MIRDWRDSLDDMVEYAEKAQAFIGAMTWSDFQADEKTRFATVRAIEIVGEAARRIPAEIRERHPDIPWQQMVGMRNVLAHDYVGTNPRIIYDTVTIFIPDLLARLRRVIAALGDTA